MTYPKGYEPTREKIKHFLWGVVFVGIFASMFLGIIVLQLLSISSHAKIPLLSIIYDMNTWIAAVILASIALLLRLVILRRFKPY